LILIIYGTPSVFAQLTEDFESGSKGSYTSGTVDFESGEWLLDDALVGTMDGDRKNGEQSVRLRDGLLEMFFDYDEGAGEVRFYAANAGFSNDSGGVISLHYSTDGGDTWQQAGENVELTDQLEEYSIPLTITDPVRFRFEKEEGGRINIDDFQIDGFTELADQPELQLSVNGTPIDSGEEMRFPIINPGQLDQVEIRIRNGGEPELVISDASFTGSGSSLFDLNPAVDGSITGGESITSEITFQPAEAGEWSAELTLQSNDPDQPEFTLNLSAEAVSEDTQITMEKARDVAFGTRVKLAGRVSAGEEFNGPVHFQDQTGGFAVYDTDLIDLAERGDSIIVTGPVTEYNPIDGTPGLFLRQIAPVEGDSDIQFEIVDVERDEPQPEVISISEMNSGPFESRLVRLEGVTIEEAGQFQGDSNYIIRDGSDTAQLRIDGEVESLVEALIPQEEIDITGVVDRFNGNYQIKPRDNRDLEAEPYVPEGEDIDKDLTFDVVTWNVEWFGSESNGPEDVDLQIDNVVQVIEEIDADVYAFQEISSQTAFFSLAERLDAYRGFSSSYSQSQQTAYLFKTAVVDSLDSGLLFEGQDSFDWAGRLPLFFEVEATVDGKSRRILLYNIHAKAFGDQPSYNRRLSAANSLKKYLDENHSSSRVIFLGDYNDELTRSTYDGAEESPYSVFLEDDFYEALTLPLEEMGFASYEGGNLRSFLDHITINNRLKEYHINGAQRVEPVSYIDDFFTTTSDHAPVWTRFQFTGEAVELPEEITVKPNYPNPFNPSTVIPFSLPEPTEVTLEIFDVLGRKVASPTVNQSFSEGDHEIEFNASGLSSGVYIYRIRFGDGTNVTEKMMLVK